MGLGELAQGMDRLAPVHVQPEQILGCAEIDVGGKDQLQTEIVGGVLYQLPGAQFLGRLAQRPRQGDFIEASAQFAGRFAPFDAARLARQRGIALARREMRQHLLADVAAAINVQQFAVCAIKGKGAGRFRQVVDQRRIDLRWQFGAADDRIDRAPDRLGRQDFVPALPEVAQHLCVGERTMAVADAQAVALDQRIQIVPVMLGKQLARQLHRA